MSIFVVGTDTEIGKTVVSALICAKLREHGPLAYWKPVASGAIEGRDVEEVSRLSGVEVIEETYLFQDPLSPHLAARIEERRVDPARLTARFRQLLEESPGRGLVIEGIGGIHVPLNDDGYLWSDWMQELDLPSVVVARSTLGTINHTLMTLECLRSRGLSVVGVILNGPINPENRSAIRNFGSVPILGQLLPQDPLDLDGLAISAKSLDLEGRLRAALW